MASFEAKDSSFCAQQDANSANNLDLNQNHKKSHKLHNHLHHHHHRQSSSPVGSSSSSVSSISPNGETIIAQDSPAATADAQSLSSRGAYERSPIEPFYPIPINSSSSCANNGSGNNASNSGLSPMEQYRLQFYNYAMVERLRNQNHTNLQHLYPPAAAAAYNSRLALSMSLFHNRVFQPEEPKPQHSYIGLIAMAILSTADQKLVLSDIYQHILDNYPYFRTRGPGWRNSIRHNLSLNDCFIKAGRSANGKGHYWGIHPANLEDFKRGDFRRRKAQRKVRKHMGLAVDDDGSDSPSPPPLTLSPPPGLGFPMSPFGFRFGGAADVASHWTPMMNAATLYTHSSRKRQFDVASLLAPDTDDQTKIEQLYPSAKRFHLASPVAAVSDQDEDIDVVAEDDCNEDRRSNSESTSSYLQPPAHHHYHRSWSNLCLPAFDPRLIGRCYGQYMAQHLPSAVNKRLFNGENQSQPSEIAIGGGKDGAETTLLDISRKDGEV